MQHDRTRINRMSSKQTNTYAYLSFSFLFPCRKEANTLVRACELPARPKILTIEATSGHFFEFFGHSPRALGRDISLENA